jgi:hypothetical protein
MHCRCSFYSFDIWISPEDGPIKTETCIDNKNCSGVDWLIYILILGFALSLVERITFSCISTQCDLCIAWDSNLTHYETYQFLAVASFKMAAVWDTAPCSLVETDWRFRGAYCLHRHGVSVMEVVRSSETSVNFYEITRRSIQEGCNFWSLSNTNHF